MAAQAAMQRPKLVVVDTNILIHRAANSAPANNLLLRLVRMGFTTVVTPTVVQELAYGADHAATVELKGLFMLALSDMIQWGVQPFNLKPVGNGICEIVANVIADRGLLPEHEKNDACILIESSFTAAAMLITWDNHLLRADNAALNEVLKSFDLHPVQIVRPELILEK